MNCNMCRLLRGFGWFRFNDPLRQYFCLYRAVYKGEGEGREPYLKEREKDESRIQERGRRTRAVSKREGEGREQYAREREKDESRIQERGRRTREKIEEN